MIKEQASLLEILTEVLDRPYPYSKSGSGVYRFKTDYGHTYGVVFSPEPGNGKGNWFMSFYLVGEVEQRYDATGTGDEIRVFATVVAVAIEFMEQPDVRKLTFSGAAIVRSRISLYTALAKRYASKYGLDLRMYYDGGDKVYELTKK